MTLLVCTACDPLVHRLPLDLAASVRVMRDGPVAVGESLDVEFTVVNVGHAAVRACFGPAFEVVFWNGREPDGTIIVVDHPGCEQRFELAPGESASRKYATTVPPIAAGIATIGGGVQVVDPRNCDRYGCDRAWLRISKGPSVDVRSNAP